MLQLLFWISVVHATVLHYPSGKKSSQHFINGHSRDGQCWWQFALNQNSTQRKSKVIQIFDSRGIRLRNMANRMDLKPPKINLSYPKTYTRAQKVWNFVKRFKSYGPVKFWQNIRKFTKLYRAVTFEPFDEISNFLCPSIGFWVW